MLVVLSRVLVASGDGQRGRCPSNGYCVSADEVGAGQKCVSEGVGNSQQADAE